ncbi:hypothetical protein FZEAL_722 [Fusarium zealandicum]|uniref:Extracellular membrane protein CFEM domain-containing protein n=1 Tax=Fusarium zealandicum TaxID=1053134 RepID=A0A8H4UUW6_9HYPO|nr:hypothetical protein FZEAL_722 [Fusarium zealandicum]
MLSSNLLAGALAILSIGVVNAGPCRLSSGSTESTTLETTTTSTEASSETSIESSTATQSITSTDTSTITSAATTSQDMTLTSSYMSTSTFFPADLFPCTDDIDCYLGLSGCDDIRCGCVDLFCQSFGPDTTTSAAPATTTTATPDLTSCSTSDECLANMELCARDGLNACVCLDAVCVNVDPLPT